MLGLFQIEPAVIERPVLRVESSSVIFSVKNMGVFLLE